MSIDYKRVYQEFEQLKKEKDLSEYSSELYEINRLINTVPFDLARAAQLSSYLADKYEKEINQKYGGLSGKTVVKGPPREKTAAELLDDLVFFKDHIPVFALNREIKNEVIKTILGYLEKEKVLPQCVINP